jgi:phage replication O-like protein O
VASPQLKNGHTRIANEILEALSRAPLNGAAFRIALWVLRETYGWQRKVAEITLRKISKMTVLNYRTVQREVKGLLQCGVLRREFDKEGKSWFGIVKDYETWRLSGISTCGQQTVCGQLTLQDTVNRPHRARSTDRTNNKERIKKKESVPGRERQADSRHQSIRKHYLERTKEKTGTAPWNGGDGSALNTVLAQNPDTPAEEIIRWLDNAFDSELKIYLPNGFRFTQFGKYYSQYTRGPLLEGNHGGNGLGSKEGSLTQEELHRLTKGKHERQQPATA